MHHKPNLIFTNFDPYHSMHCTNDQLPSVQPFQIYGGIALGWLHILHTVWLSHMHPFVQSGIGINEYLW